MIVNNSPAVMKALSNLRKQIVDGCPICHGSELGCRCRFKMMLYEEAAKSNVPMGVISKTFSDFGLGQEDNEMVVALKDKWKHII